MAYHDAENLRPRRKGTNMEFRYDLSQYTTHELKMLEDDITSGYNVKYHKGHSIARQMLVEAVTRLEQKLIAEGSKTGKLEELVGELETEVRFLKSTSDRLEKRAEAAEKVADGRAVVNRDLQDRLSHSHQERESLAHDFMTYRAEKTREVEDLCARIRQAEEASGTDAIKDVGLKKLHDEKLQLLVEIETHKKRNRQMYDELYWIRKAHGVSKWKLEQAEKGAKVHREQRELWRTGILEIAKEKRELQTLVEKKDKRITQLEDSEAGLIEGLSRTKGAVVGLRMKSAALVKQVEIKDEQITDLEAKNDLLNQHNTAGEISREVIERLEQKLFEKNCEIQEKGEKITELTNSVAWLRQGLERTKFELGRLEDDVI